MTIWSADAGDTHKLRETSAEAVEQLDQVTANGEPVALAGEVAADKGCRSRAVVLELTTPDFRTSRVPHRSGSDGFTRRPEYDSRAADRADQAVVEHGRW